MIASYIVQILTTLLLVVDWGQTRNIKNVPGAYEINKILGPHPSDRRIDIYFLVCIAVTLTVANLLPQPWGLWGTTAVGLLEAVVILRNYRLGSKIDFK